jgi:hypothetical protein
VQTPKRVPIRFMLAAAACMGLLDGNGANAGESKTALQVFGSLPAIEDMAMSPDGTKFAYVRTEGDRRSVLIRQLGEAKPLGAFRVGDTKLKKYNPAD